MNPAAVTFLTGVLVIMTSGCVGLHEILLDPKSENYPDARGRIRWLMFAWAVALLYRGAEIIAGLWAPEPVYVTLGTVIATSILAGVQAMLLENVLRQWLPARLQRRVQQLIAIASCKNSRGIARARKSALSRAGLTPQHAAPASAVGPALAELALEGFRVVGPNEPPSSLNA